MQKTITELSLIKLVGLKIRTNNISEMDPSTAKIGSTMQRYFNEAFPSRIINQAKPGVTYCVYTEYESGVSGDYTYFIGEEVTSFEGVNEDLKTISIPAQSYAKFTNQPGPMPKVCIDMWQNIWKMSTEALGGERGYLADFEVYDARAADPLNTVLDIYIGIRK